MSLNELAVANVVHKFDFALPDGAEDLDMTETTGITVHKKSPILQLIVKFEIPISGTNHFQNECFVGLVVVGGYEWLPKGSTAGSWPAKVDIPALEWFTGHIAAAGHLSGIWACAWMLPGVF
ncbi:hypothetical protein RJ639_020014 [Escallonia herrerae]|uniref:Uncharacterized protein n=1 Tax=Escallonia herrerae TaxID=1293975 RepID=A0AA88V9P6_9ASTE|nr:hypothetical protein RJ639_020014 [Escallonia herrerae]